MHHLPHDTGWIEVITGCMFSGKTEELIRRLNRARYAKQRVVIFKPSIDDRYSADSVVSHSKQKLQAISVKVAKDITDHVDDYDVIGIDEAQFLGEGVVPVAERLADSGKRVIVAGLDQDFLGRPFHPIPHLMAVAEYVTKNLAICMQCGNPADRSQRLIRRDATVVVGGTESYEARCRRCFTPQPIEQERLFETAPPPAASAP